MFEVATLAAGDAAALIDSISGLIATLIWPALILFLVLRFGGQVGRETRELIHDRQFTAKAGPGGVEFEVGERVAEQLITQADAKVPGEAPDPDRVKAAVASMARPAQPVSRRLLWVDDRPGNNHLERAAFEALGFEIDLATSTEEAVELVERSNYDVVISDMGRPGDDRAGYTLLDELRRRGHQVPYVIYAGSRARAHAEEARQHGAVGSTNRASELLQLVASALTQTSGVRRLP